MASNRTITGFLDVPVLVLDAYHCLSLVVVLVLNLMSHSSPKLSHIHEHLESMDSENLSVEPSNTYSTESAPFSPAKRPKKDKRVFKEEWKVKYLMWPVESIGGSDTGDFVTEICVQCQERLKAKSSTATRHLERKHHSSLSVSNERKQRLVKQKNNSQQLLQH